MSIKYRAIHWNNHKKGYDLLLALLIVVYLIIFIFSSKLLHPNLDPVNLLIRAFGSLALVLLHVVLLIGPLCRLNPNFLPLLYNRRHLGVSTFLIAAFHGILSLIQYHGSGNSNTLVSLFTSNTQYNSLAQFPFHVLGFFALCIFFFMAATSHDFWLKNLGQNFWKRLHMFIYFAYLLVIMHVMLGIIQVESSPILLIILLLGFTSVIALHLLTAYREIALDKKKYKLMEDGFLAIGKADLWEEGKARIIQNGKERIAVFRHQNQFSALSNRCAHQGGPLGEGQIIDELITCPWHAYQYRTDDASSPPPFTEKVASYQLKIVGDELFIDPLPYPDGTRLEKAKLS